MYFVFFFFFQAEDGIRDFHVTGVQTCALPIASKGTQLETKPASISGLAGRTYSWTYTNAGGIKLHTAMTLVQLDGKWLASCTKLEVDGNSPADQQLADTAMQSVKLVKGAK